MDSSAAMQPMPMHYSWPLIVASVCVSIIAAYAAFCFAERLSRAEGSRRRWWLAAGSTVMGLGIWSMHYLGMLAVSMPMDMRYSLPVVGLSLLLAAGAAAVALHAVGRQKVSSGRLAVSTILMGAGIAAMHYTGMAAMRCPAVQHYSPLWVGLSVLVALGFSLLSLVITFRLRDGAAHSERLRIAGAVVMGLGIAAMHYTAMHAVTFLPAAEPASGHGVHVGMLGAVGVLLTAMLLLAGAMVAAILDRVTYQQLRDAHAELESAQSRLRQAQQTLLASEHALAEANQRLQDLSIRDALTQVYNRRYFADVMEVEWRRAVREKAMLAFLMIDIDYFKRWNDRVGRAAGDQLLQAVAGALSVVTHATGGVLARYGADEFAAFVPVSREMESHVHAAQMREAVAALRLDGEAAEIRATVSIGLVTANSRVFSSPEAALKAADTALYRAKLLGRNRVESAEAGPLAAWQELGGASERGTPVTAG